MTRATFAIVVGAAWLVACSTISVPASRSALPQEGVPASDVNDEPVVQDPTPFDRTPDRAPADATLSDGAANAPLANGPAPEAEAARDTIYIVDAPALADTPVFADEMFTPASIDPELALRVDGIMNAPLIRQMHWGIIARDLHTGRVIYEQNSQRKFVPASNMKVLTAAAALTELGPDFRFETGLWSFADLDRQGVLDGPLVLDGRGDPTLSGRYHASGRAALALLASRLRAAGVRRVAGPLIIDASRWDSTSAEGSWMVEDLGWPWGASGGAFAIDEGEIEVVVHGGRAAGDPADVVWPADLRPDRFRDDVVTTAVDTIDLHPTFRSGSKQVVLGGRIKPSIRRRESLAARDPVGIAGELLLQALQAEGVRVDGGLEYRWEPGEPLGRGCVTAAVDQCTARRLAALESPRLIDIVTGFLGPSQNWVSEQVVRSLGLERGARGSWEEGLRVLEQTLTRDFAVLSNDLDLRDGSGLSAYDLVTARALVDVLFKIRIQPVGAAFREALATPGERGTTLSGRLRDLQGRLYVKTGTLTHVNSLSGYLERDNGREMVFAILTGGSGMESSEVRDALDALVRELARW